MREGGRGGRIVLSVLARARWLLLVVVLLGGFSGVGRARMAPTAGPPANTPFRGSLGAGSIGFQVHGLFFGNAGRYIHALRFGNACAGNVTKVNARIPIGRNGRFSYQAIGLRIAGELHRVTVKGFVSVYANGCDIDLLSFSAQER
jgi:hypothetical protein